jgi:hypothetical protein
MRMEASTGRSSDTAKCEREDALFQDLLRRIPSLTDRTQLRESAILALKLMLRRPGDVAQLAESIAAIDHALREEPSDSRRAASRCVQVLQAAKRTRQPRTHLHPHHPPPRRSAWQGRLVGAALLLAFAWGGVALVMRGRAPGTAEQSAATLIEQMELAGRGGGPNTHVFGGALKVEKAGGGTVVVAEKVPPRICVEAGWALVRKGRLTINGDTPARVSAGKITELCNQEEGAATIAWVPKN